MSYPWPKMNLVPLDGLELWHQYEPDVSTGGLINDYSGHDRHVVAASNTPVLTDDVINGQPGWYFNGSRTPLSYSGSIPSLKHMFVVASVDEATFGDYRGVMSGVTAGDILTGDDGTDKFFDHSATSYTKNGVAFANDNQKAPMSNAIAILEIVYAAGVAVDGIQYGKHKDQTGRLHKGYFLEGLAYSVVKNDIARLRVFEYLAMRYHLWQKTASGLNVFPFHTNKARSAELDQEHSLSEPYSGPKKALVRGDAARAFSLPFTTRTQPEFEATEAFHGQHYPLTHFIFRDYRFYPARETECMITSSLKEQGSDVTYRFNYTFDIMEVS